MHTQTEFNNRHVKRTTVKVARKPVKWDEYPRELLGALATAGRGTFVAMQGVTYREAHSVRTRLRFMQKDIVALYAVTPSKLVDVAERVHWYVEDDKGVKDLSGLRNSPRLREPVWRLIGTPVTTAATADLRLPKNVDKLIEEMVG